MVLHGGQQGELTLYGMPTEYVYEWTAAELRSKIDIGEGEMMPTLEEVLCLFKGQRMLLNIELKAPNKAEFKPRYNCEVAAETVYNMICAHQISHLVMISSF
jgi:hypothetical protein